MQSWRTAAGCRQARPVPVSVMFVPSCSQRQLQWPVLQRLQALQQLPRQGLLICNVTLRFVWQLLADIASLASPATRTDPKSCDRCTDGLLLRFSLAELSSARRCSIGRTKTPALQQFKSLCCMFTPDWRLRVAPVCQRGQRQSAFAVPASAAPDHTRDA